MSKICSICLDDSDTADVPLACGHLFHGSCIVPWLQREARTDCPVCRHDPRCGPQEIADENGDRDLTYGGSLMDWMLAGRLARRQSIARAGRRSKSKTATARLKRAGTNYKMWTSRVRAARVAFTEARAKQVRSETQLRGKLKAHLRHMQLGWRDIRRQHATETADTTLGWKKTTKALHHAERMKERSASRLIGRGG